MNSFFLFFVSHSCIYWPINIAFLESECSQNYYHHVFISSLFFVTPCLCCVLYVVLCAGCFVAFSGAFFEYPYLQGEKLVILYFIHFWLLVPFSPQTCFEDRTHFEGQPPLVWNQDTRHRQKKLQEIIVLAFQHLSFRKQASHTCAGVCGSDRAPPLPRAVPHPFVPGVQCPPSSIVKVFCPNGRISAPARGRRSRLVCNLCFQYAADAEEQADDSLPGTLSSIFFTRCASPLLFIKVPLEMTPQLAPRRVQPSFSDLCYLQVDLEEKPFLNELLGFWANINRVTQD